MKRGTPRHPKTPQYIYAIELCGLVKIGRSAYPHLRAKHLSAVRFKPQMLAVQIADDAKRDERLLHYIFRFKMAGTLSCEWFRIPPEDAKWAIENIDVIRSIDVPHDFSPLKFWRGRR